MKFDLFAAQFVDLRTLLPWYQTRKEKTVLRGIMEQRRRILTDEQVEEQSNTIVEKIESLRRFQEAKVVMLYYPVHHEVSLKPLLEKYWQEKTLLLPVTHRHTMELRPYLGKELLRKGRYSIPEPLTDTYTGPIDLIIVPGVAFDQHRNRLGRGGGYYDKFLRKHKDIFSIGVCFDSQFRQHKELPHGYSDQPVNMVITPSKTIGE